MAAVKGIVIEGQEELSDTLLELLPREVAAIGRAVALGIATEVASKISARAPRDTGQLAGDVIAVKGKQKTGRPSAEVRIKDQSFYWRFAEFGTVKQRAKPFIVPTIEEVRPGLGAQWREGFGKKVEEAVAQKSRKRRR